MPLSLPLNQRSPTRKTPDADDSPLLTTQATTSITKSLPTTSIPSTTTCASLNLEQETSTMAYTSSSTLKITQAAAPPPERNQQSPSWVSSAGLASLPRPCLQPDFVPEFDQIEDPFPSITDDHAMPTRSTCQVTFDIIQVALESCARSINVSPGLLLQQFVSTRTSGQITPKQFTLPHPTSLPPSPESHEVQLKSPSTRKPFSAFRRTSPLQDGLSGSNELDENSDSGDSWKGPRKKPVGPQSDSDEEAPPRRIGNTRTKTGAIVSDSDSQLHSDGIAGDSKSDTPVRNTRKKPKQTTGRSSVAMAKRSNLGQAIKDRFISMAEDLGVQLSASRLWTGLIPTMAERGLWIQNWPDDVDWPPARGSSSTTRGRSTALLKRGPGISRIPEAQKRILWKSLNLAKKPLKFVKSSPTHKQAILQGREPVAVGCNVHRRKFLSASEADLINQQEQSNVGSASDSGSGKSLRKHSETPRPATETEQTKHPTRGRKRKVEVVIETSAAKPGRRLRRRTEEAL